MTTGYKATVYVESSGIGHAFIKLEAPGQPPITVGYYPVVHAPSAPGMIKNDATTGEGQTIHLGDPIKTFDIDPSQYAAMVNQVNWVANHPGEYGVLGNQCTGFVVDTLKAGGISNSENYADFTVVHPTDLKIVLGSLPSDQAHTVGGVPDSAQIADQISGIYQGIDARSMASEAVEARIKPIGSVALTDPNETFTDTAGAGRGSVNPDTVASTAPATPAAFNPTTALADYHGDTSNSYTVQKGDTVGSIAIKLGMTPAELGDYLKEQYGADANLNSIVAGRSLPVPADKLTAYKEASINGLDLPAEPASTTLKPDLTDEQASAIRQDLGLPSNGPQQPGLQLADAGSNTVSDAGSGGTGTGTNPDPTSSPSTTNNPDSFTNYLQGPGASLTPAQQDALASQLDQLGLGGDADLSFYALPDGGVLIGNAEGDIVGEINHSASGDLNLRANSINADASAEPVSTHIREDGQTLSQSQYETQAAQQGVALFNSLNNLQSWDQMSDLGKLSAVVGLYNQMDGLGNAFGGSGNNLPGDLGAAAGWLSLAQGIESGDSLIIANGLNSVSDGAIDGAINNALGSEGVPYLGYVLALRNFADDPEQAVGTMAGTYVGEIVGAYFGPVGSVIGGAIGGMLGGMLGGLFGGDDPPAPAGSAHFGWDANGNIQHTIDFDQSGGGHAANSVAASVQGMLEQIVQAINAKNPSTADDVAINPYCLPRVSFNEDAGGATMEITLGNGQVASQQVNSPQFSEWLLKVVQDTGGIAPAWQVQTLQMHAQQMREQGVDEAQVAAAAGITNTYVAQVGDAATSVQGNAAESADFKSQTFGALVVHLHDDPNVQAAQVQLSNVLRDIDSDGYFEQTQWVSASDAQGNLQGMLVLDQNQNGQIETRDILNLGGNAGQNADLQRNNVQWLDANGDGQLDVRDPAFAAIRLWVDVNQDGTMQAGEGKSLEDLQIKSINFEKGEITYADGSTDALTAATLKGDTEGTKLTQIQEADANGVLHALDAGEVLEHEGYQGKVQITDEGGTRWAAQREQTYDQQAKRTGDWEGTIEQEAHRHGGGNVAGAPTETAATGATDFGPVKLQANQTTQSTVAQGDARVVSATLTQAAPAKPNLQAVINGGDIRIKSDAAPANSANTNNAATSAASAQAVRMAFVPSAQTSAQNEIRAVTDSMIESAQSSLFGAGTGGFSGGLGLLSAVGLGAVHATAEAAVQQTVVVSDTRSANTANTNSASSNNTFASTPSSASADAAPAVVFQQVDLGSFVVQAVSQAPTQTMMVASPQAQPASTQFVMATVIVEARVQAPSNQMSTTTTAQTVAASTTALVTEAQSAVALSLGYPQVQGETLVGSEDMVLRLAQSVLLANDSTPNASADPSLPALTITAVSDPTHGQVSLVNGEVLFMPDENFHGTARFTYTVTDQYGLSSTASATLLIEAVNDAPVTQGESVQSNEDIGLIFTQAQLLANDTDVDVATDGQSLSISRVGEAQHGTVWLDAQGNLRFVPDANYHGPAKFTYWVSDGSAASGAGAETPSIVNLTIAAVNDLPVVTGETVNSDEDVTLLFNPASLLANDTDVDAATDGQVLSITAVGNASHGSVAFVTQPDGSQQIAFTPEANYFGVASYQYTVSDGNGGTATTTVVVNLAQVNDVPVAVDDSLTATPEDTSLHISFASLLGNDTDADINNSAWGDTNDVLAVSSVGNATHGTVALVNGEVVFTPDANYHGAASFAYQVRDSSGSLAQAIATFTITAVNDAPAVLGETINSNEDTALLISPAALLQNDSDVDAATDGQTLSISAVSNAQHGTVSLNADGTISFVPEANYYGNASFNYTVSDGNGGLTTATAAIALANVNDAPVATDETIQSAEDQVLTILANALLQNDSDIDNANAELYISRVQSGTGGVAALDTNGNVVFSPTANYNGAATFTYWVRDPAGLESNAITTTIQMAAVNDAPTAQGEIVTGASEDAVFHIDKTTLLANDHDVDDPDSALDLSWLGNAYGGSVNLDANGNVVFTPNANFNGNATFQYKVRDAAGLESAVVQTVIPVLAVNDAPVAVDDQFTTYKNSTLTIAFSQLTSNDTDVDYDALTVSSVRNHANGEASIVNGQVQFVATAGFSGAASFDYLSGDGRGGQSWATAYVDVKQPPNQYPTVVLTGTSFFGTGSAGIDVAYASWYLSDDSGVASFSLQDYRVWRVSGTTWNWGQLGDVLTINENSSTGMHWDWRRYAGITQLVSTWQVTDNQGLTNVWHFNYDINLGVTANYMEHSGYYTPPVILDLNGDGVHFTPIQNSNIAFDVNHDGIKDQMAWASNDDGVLVWDKDHNGQISDASEFGFQYLKAEAQTDLEGLKVLDTNHNGLLDAGDEKFAEFAVWQDANGNGVTDAGEFKTLSALGIANINLKSDGQVHDAGTLLESSRTGETDVTVMGNAAFTRTDGSTGTVADAMLAYQPGQVSEPVPASAVSTDAQTAEVMRMALLFNQMVNTAPSMDSDPIGFVPIQPDVQLHDMLVVPHESVHQILQAA